MNYLCSFSWNSNLQIFFLNTIYSFVSYESPAAVIQWEDELLQRSEGMHGVMATVTQAIMKTIINGNKLEQTYDEIRYKE